MIHRTYSVLLVDDEEPNRLLLAKRLEQDGYTVTTAENGRQALEVLRTEHFDLVLLDMYMPVMDGLATLDAIKSDSMLQDTKIVMLTAANTREHVVHCLSLGAADYLIKPVNPVEFKQRVSRCLLNGEKHIEPTVRIATTDRKNTRILIVDNEPLTLRLLGQRLSQLGYQSLAARCGREALDLLTNEQVDAVLLDVNMPDMNGLEVLRSIREVDKWRILPVLMLSADGDEDTISRSYQLGANDYLVKPFKFHDLQLRLAVALDVAMSKMANVSTNDHIN